MVVADRASGLPVLRALSLCTCCRHYPGTATGGTALLIRPVMSAFPERVIGSACASSFSRLTQRSLALRPAHSRCHLFVARLPEGFRHFVSSMPAPVASGWSGCRVGFAPTGKRRLVTAHTQSRLPNAEADSLEAVVSRVKARPWQRRGGQATHEHRQRFQDVWFAIVPSGISASPFPARTADVAARSSLLRHVLVARRLIVINASDALLAGAVELPVQDAAVRMVEGVDGNLRKRRQCVRCAREIA